MFRMTAENLTEIYTKLNNYLFYGHKYDWRRGTTTAHSFGNTLFMKTAECDLHMHQVNYTMNKWRMLVNLYLDPAELGLMCARLRHYTQDGNSKHRQYIPDIGMTFKRRRNVSGSCLMSVTVGYNLAQGWHCEVFSRASETTMRWFVDLIFIHVLLREIGKVIGFTVKDISVTWRMVSLYQSITSMPFFVVWSGNESWLEEALKKVEGNEPHEYDPWQVATAKRYRKTYLDGNYQNFRVQRRPMEGYLMMKGLMEPKDPVWTHELTLPDIDLQQHIDFAEDEENDCFGAGGYR